MATCPDCGQFLSTDHRCHAKEWRTARRTGIAIAGALVGASLPFLFPGYNASLLAIIVVGALGAIIGSAIFGGLR